jgi:hypothetical protein
MTDQLDPKTAVFVDGLSKVLADLNEVRTRDPEAVMLIGSLADRLSKDSGKATWLEVKQGLSDAEHNSLVGTFVRQIDSAQAEGKIKVAYALQALATSLVGSRFQDKGIAAGVALLDDFIASARTFFAKNTPKTN